MDASLIVRPWIERLSQLLPSFDYLIDNLDDNLSTWQEAADLGPASPSRRASLI